MKFTDKQLAAIAAGGSFLPERLQGVLGFNPASIDETVCRERYQLWQTKAGGNGGESAFLKRLQLEGISPEKAMAVMAKPVWDSKSPLPEWVEELQAICELFPFNSAELPEKPFFVQQAETLPENEPVEALLPFIVYAERRLQERLGKRKQLFTYTAYSDLSAFLMKSLSKLCLPTFRYRFRLFQSAKNPLSILMTDASSEQTKRNWRELVSEALAGGWLKILVEYPVLGRLIVVLIKQWVDNITELAGFVAADAKQLGTLFFNGATLGAVTGVTAGISDPHNNGRGVYILEFGPGRKIVFKSRSLKIDEIWGELLAWVNQKEIPAPLKTPPVLDLGDHGWMEFIQNDPLIDQEAAGRYYFRCGVMVGLIYALGGNDFHIENLIAWGEHPALIDTETLLQHRVRPFQLDPAGFSASEKALASMNDSVIWSGFFPLWRNKGPGEPPDDIGALTGKNEDCGNLPLLDGVYLKVADYHGPLFEGFQWIYDCLIRNRRELLGAGSPLERFGQCKFRFLIRASWVYGSMLRRITGPQFLRDGLVYSIEIDRLAAAFLVAAPEDILKKLWPIFKSEYAALHRRDFPIFYGGAESLCLMDATTDLYEKYFIQSAVSRAREKIGQLNQDDLCTQLDLMENSLGVYARKPGDGDAAAIVDAFPGLEEIPLATDKELLAAAGRIYEEMLAQRIFGNDSGDTTWIVQTFDLLTNTPALERIGIPLYDGVLGLVLFMAALYRLTRKEEIKAQALKGIRVLRDALRDPVRPFPVHRGSLGLGSGLAGLITVLMNSANYLDESSLVEDVRYILHQISAAQIDSDRQYDVLSGSAGLILALAKFGSQIRDEKVLQLARYCGRHLLAGRAKAQSGHRVWISEIHNAPLTGMGHGAAGMACALLKLYGLTGEREYLEAAQEAIAYETALYVPEQFNWPDLRKDQPREDGQPVFMEGWCNGAPGIGMARLASLHLLKTPAIMQDIENAITFTLRYPVDETDHLCCGNSSRIDFLIEAALALERPDLLEEACKRLGWMLMRKEAKGRYNLNNKGKVFNPSFFQGTAGIGYELLRCIAPRDIKSVLN